MKKVVLFFSFVFILSQTACGPAAESRDTMHKRAKEVHDSLAKTIKDAIDEVETLTKVNVVKPDTAQKTAK